MIGRIVVVLESCISMLTNNDGQPFVLHFDLLQTQLFVTFLTSIASSERQQCQIPNAQVRGQTISLGLQPNFAIPG